LPKDLYEAYKEKKKSEFDDIQTTCNTDKASKFYSCNFKCKTRGLIIIAFNCGIIICFREMYGAESLRHVSHLYLDMIDHFCGTISEIFIVLFKMFIILFIGLIPSYLVYDNACNLRCFCLNSKNRQLIDSNGVDRGRTAIFDKVIFVVDRLHIQGHVDPTCLATCHPKLFPDLIGKNTQVCEQTNFWIGKYKYNVKHMNYVRFNFYFYIIFNEHNKLKMLGVHNFNDINNSRTK